MKTALDRFNQKLINEASGFDIMEERRQAIFRRWAQTPLLRKLNENEAKDVAILLENQAITLKKMQNENTNTSDLATFNKVAFPLVRRVYGGLISKDIVSVQPMSAPQTMVFYIDYTYVNAAGENLGYPYGKRESNAFEAADFDRDYSSYQTTQSIVLTGGLVTDTENGQSYLNLTTATNITSAVEWGSIMKIVTSAGTTAWASANWNYGSVTQSNPYGAPTQYMGSFHLGRLYVYKAVNSSNTELTGGTLTTALTGHGAMTLTYYQRATIDTSEGVSGTPIPRISFEMKSKPVEAKTRKLMVQWTTEVEQDAKAYHGLDVEKTLTDFLTEHITLEIDREIIFDLYEGYDKTLLETWDISASPSGLGQYSTYEEFHRGLVRAMNTLSHKIFTSTKRGPATFALVSPEVAAILESLPEFISINDGSGNITGAGVKKSGAISKKWDIYVDPLLAGTVNYNKILMGYKGNNVYDCGYIYAPYVIGVMSPVIYHPDELFTPRRGILSRYGKVWIRRDFYGVVRVDGLDSFATGTYLMQNK